MATRRAMARPARAKAGRQAGRVKAGLARAMRGDLRAAGVKGAGGGE